jgi:beta-glucosidase/6-phospho-beta-glucosidase/beta-galactosidase
VSKRFQTSFTWAVGIEDTVIGSPLRSGGRLDEYRLTGHADRCRADLELAAEAGAKAIRYGIPWHDANPSPGRFVWDWADRTLAYAAETLGLEVILDLVHYGTPDWLVDSFADRAYPAAIAEYAEALATRYRGTVRAYTPFNEPLVAASFCGLRGVWPPYLTGDRGWATVVASVIDGIQETTRAIRRADAAAEIVHVEAVQLYETSDDSLRPEMELWRARSLLPTDLLLGRTKRDGEAVRWLEHQGVSGDTVERLLAGAIVPDVLGLNYYPELSCRELLLRDGATVQVATNGGAEGLAAVIRGFYERYRLPVMITETAVEGDVNHRTRWLNEATASVDRLIADGIPLVGFTWWPLFDFVDWSWASGGEVVEEFFVRDEPDGEPHSVAPLGTPGGPVEPFLRRMGMYRLEAEGTTLRPVPTTLVDRFRALAGREPGGAAVRMGRR